MHYIRKKRELKFCMDPANINKHTHTHTHTYLKHKKGGQFRSMQQPLHDILQLLINCAKTGGDVADTGRRGDHGLQLDQVTVDGIGRSVPEHQPWGKREVEMNTASKENEHVNRKTDRQTHTTDKHNNICA